MPSPILFWSTSATPAQDDAIGLQPLDTFSSRGVEEQANAVADLGDGQGGILLQHGQDLAVDGVEPAIWL